MESRLNNYDIKNLISRIFSAIVFIPLVIMPIIFKGYILFLVYIFLLSLMVSELIDMVKISKKKNIYILIFVNLCLDSFYFHSFDFINRKCKF